MIRIFLALFALLAAVTFSSSAANAQSLRWSVDTIIYRYEHCSLPDTTIHFWLINDSTGAKTLEGVDIYPYAWAITDHPNFPVTIQPGDSVAFTMQPFSHQTLGVLSMKITPSGNPETFLRFIQFPNEPLLVTSPQLVKIDPTLIGTTGGVTFFLVNRGNRDYIHRSIEKGNNVELSGLKLGDVIKAGDSVMLTVSITSKQRGSASNKISIGDLCMTSSIFINTNFFTNGPQWSTQLLQGTVSGCDTGTIHKVNVSSNIVEFGTVDSIGFSPELAGWSLADPASVPFQVSNASEHTLSLRREPLSNTEGYLLLYPHNRPVDTIWISLAYYAARIAFDTPSDTTILEVEPGSSRSLSIFVQNTGGRPNWLRSLELGQNQGWSIVGFDSTARLGAMAKSPISLSFAGNPIEGDYPVTISIRDSLCEMLITHTIVARVQETNDVTQHEALSSLALYPSIASSQFTIEASGSFSYAVVDMLGNTVLNGRSHGSETLRVDHLPQGRYYVRVEFAGHAQTRSVVVVR